MGGLPVCNMLWFDQPLGRTERACMRSVLAAGHALHLYRYEPLHGVPAGVTVRNAADILPPERIIRHRRGSVALFANWFRYELLRQGRGIWLDADCYLLKPLPGDRPWLFGREDDRLIANGILAMPPDAPILDELIELFAEQRVPDWLSFRHRLAARVRRRLTGRTGLAHMPWGSAGPQALTALAAKFGVADQALPPVYFYPVHWRDARWLLDPSRPLASVIGEETVAIHLWNEVIKGFKHWPAPPGSFLHRLQAEGAPGAG